MVEWYNALGVYQQVLFVIALASTLFMLIQLISMLIGMGGHEDFDPSTDVDGDIDVANDVNIFSAFALKFLSMRSIIAFLCIGSWMTFAFTHAMHWAGATALGVLCGLLASLAVVMFMQAISKLQNNGNLESKNMLGKVGDVYLTIPAEKSGKGKINITVQEQLREVEAMTEGEAIVTGDSCKVVGIVSDNLVMVEPLERLAKGI